MLRTGGKTETAQAEEAWAVIADQPRQELQHSTELYYTSHPSFYPPREQRWRMAALPVVQESLSNADWQEEGLRSIAEHYRQLQSACRTAREVCGPSCPGV